MSLLPDILGDLLECIIELVMQIPSGTSAGPCPDAPLSREAAARSARQRDLQRCQTTDRGRAGKAAGRSARL